MSNEMLEVLRDCWDGTPKAFEVQHMSIRDRIMLFPTPEQSAGVPLLGGGMGKASLRRAATLGDGWLAIADVDTLDLETLREQIKYVQELRAQTTDAPFELVLKLKADPSSASKLPSALAQVAALGFDEAVIDVPWAHSIASATDSIATCRDAAQSASSPQRR